MDKFKHRRQNRIAGCNDARREENELGNSFLRKRQQHSKYWQHDDDILTRAHTKNSNFYAKTLERSNSTHEKHRVMMKYFDRNL